VAWIALVIAGGFETFGVAMMNEYTLKNKRWALLLVIIGFGGSLGLLSFATKTLPMGTAYAVWTGIGTVGGALVGMLFYGESRGWRRIFFIALILMAAVGLKITE
jgi:paired small multidrug resistance pump